MINVLLLLVCKYSALLGENYLYQASMCFIVYGRLGLVIMCFIVYCRLWLEPISNCIVQTILMCRFFKNCSLFTDIFKVYCADHTYSTLRLPMDSTVGEIIASARDKLCLGDDPVLCEVKSTGGQSTVVFTHSSTLLGWYRI